MPAAGPGSRSDTDELSYPVGTPPPVFPSGANTGHVHLTKIILTEVTVFVLLYPDVIGY